MQNIRLQKVIAQAGVASRRKAEQLIVQGRVKVNGKITTILGTQVDPAVDVVAVDDRRLLRHLPQSHYILLNKPRGYVTTCDDERGRLTVLDLLKHQPGRLFPVGRLDVNSEGVLLLTNDGTLAHRLMHPRYRIPRTYLVKLQGIVADQEIERLRRGMVLEDGRTLPAQVHIVRRTAKSCLLRLTLYEGRHRQIHRMLQRCGGHTVKKLQRTAMGPLAVAGLPLGNYRVLESFEVTRLRRACHLDKRVS
ncbi:MAG: pseudouridine synthase [Candidatus Tectomicrobia bacterium]